MTFNLFSKTFTFFLSSILLIPLAMIVLGSINLSSEDIETWIFFSENILVESSYNSFIIATLTTLFSLIIGTITAITYCFTNIAFKRIMNILFIIPLAMPLYVFSFIYVGIFEDLNLPLKNLFGISFIFSLALFPYVFLLAKNAFYSVSTKHIWAAGTMGLRPFSIFRKLILPFSRPWILSAAFIILMDVLADFGGASVFNIETLTTAIYTSWKGFFSLSIAARISSLLILLAIVLVYSEKHYRSKTINFNFKRSEEFLLLENSLFIKFILKLISYIVVFFSSILPILTLITWSLESIEELWSFEYLQIIFNTFSLALSVAFIVTSFALILNFIIRVKNKSKVKKILPLYSLGYAMPGNIIAIAAFSFFSFFSLNNGKSELFIFLTLALGLTIKVFSISHRVLENFYKKTPLKIDHAAMNLGVKRSRLLMALHLPMMKNTLKASMLLCFLEIIKEMPLTLMLRPFSFTTLSVKVYELTSEGQWERAAFSGLLLTFLGALGVITFNYKKNSND